MSDRQDPRASGRSQRQRPLSYKFQRLREQIRSAVLNGEFHGRLPGERELGRMYNANAKTINKALSDLSAEGLLVRRIGKGTFVARQSGNTAESLAVRKIHVVAKAMENGGGQLSQRVIDLVVSRLRDRGHEVFARSLPLVDGHLEMPSEIMRDADAVIWLTLDPLSQKQSRLKNTDALELMRRQIPLVAVGAIGNGPRRNTVVPDYTDAGFRLTQHLILAGSGRLVLLAVPDAGREFDLLYAGCSTAAARYGRTVERVSLASSQGTFRMPEWRELFGSSEGIEAAGPLGLICAGRPAVMALVDENAGGGPNLLRRVIPACIDEPGESLCDRFDLTAYEVAMEDMVGQAIHLGSNTRAGDVPIEIAVPGQVCLRGSLSAARLAVPQGDEGPHVPVCRCDSTSPVAQGLG